MEIISIWCLKFIEEKVRFKVGSYKLQRSKNGHARGDVHGLCTGYWTTSRLVTCRLVDLDSTESKVHHSSQLYSRLMSRICRLIGILAVFFSGFDSTSSLI